MGWADNYIKHLQEGKTVQFRPRGKSMTGLVNDGQLVTVDPRAAGDVGSVCLCLVNGRQYLHKVLAVSERGWQIGNNKGGVNGWTRKIYGVVTKVED